MDNILFVIAVIAIGWVAYRSHKQEPVIPSFASLRKKNDTEDDLVGNKKSHSKNKHLIENLIGINDIRNGLIHLPKDKYVMAIKCEPVNYHLRNNLEQEGIDAKYEQWLTAIDYETITHVQNRQVDFRMQQEDFLQNIEEDTLLNDNARNYCFMTLEYMNQWLTSQPRFEQVRYVLFPYKVSASSKTSKVADDETRAKRELSRRASAAQNYLESCGVKSVVCGTGDLVEMFYHSLNRKRSNKARFKDIQLQEMLAYYCTSEQDSIRIEKVKEDAV